MPDIENLVLSQRESFSWSSDENLGGQLHNLQQKTAVLQNVLKGTSSREKGLFLYAGKLQSCSTIIMRWHLS